MFENKRIAVLGAGKLGEALQKLAQFVSLIGHWTAAHRSRG